jgi:hypothetical protein
VKIGHLIAWVNTHDAFGAHDEFDAHGVLAYSAKLPTNCTGNYRHINLQEA